MRTRRASVVSCHSSKRRVGATGWQLSLRSNRYSLRQSAKVGFRWAHAQNLRRSEAKMPTDYRRNHYVPVWYQKRFFPAGQTSREFFYLDLRPPFLDLGGGAIQVSSGLSRRGPKKSFVEPDLYTRFIGTEPNTDVEQQFFGEVDDRGKAAIEAFGNFSYQPAALENLRVLLIYMVTQKLRTPKGMKWIEDTAGVGRDAVLAAMIENRRLFQSIWMECVWHIADARDSETKFVLSDHPVTVYNRACDPRSAYCADFQDPDIRLHGTHTLFPLSLDKIMILTNLSWVRNPYQSARAVRPNPVLQRAAMFNFMDIQVDRHLSEREVREINLVIKRRAWRYVAAAQEEWLYPERYLEDPHWARFGDGYLMMPEPRLVSGGAVQMYAGYDSGRVIATDEYGRRPGQAGWNTGDGNLGRAPLDRFQGEFARRYGPTRRARSRQYGELGPESDSEELYRHYLEQEARGKVAMEQHPD